MVLVHGKDPEEIIKTDTYDVSAWDVFIHRLKEMPIDEARPHFQRLVDAFPTCGYYWKFYIEQEMAKENWSTVDSLFQKSLCNVLNIDLWNCYVNYNLERFSKRDEYYRIREMFDFTLDKMGLDHQVYTFYNLYIDFLNNSGSKLALSSSEIRSITRQLYHIALHTPMAKYKQLWRDYCCFEQKADTRKSSERIGSMMSTYTHVQRVSHEMDSLVWSLNRKHVSVPCTNSLAESEQLTCWREYIYWEKSNPLQTNDYCLYVRRVMYAYEQALLCFMYHLECWCEPIDFLQNAAETAYQMKLDVASRQFIEEARALFERAVTSSMASTALLHCMYADFEEGQGDYVKAQKIYKSFIDNKKVDPSLAYVHYMKFANRIGGVELVRAVFKAARRDPRVNSEVYTVAAYLEYFSGNNAEVATKIFQMGMKRFVDDGDFALNYVKYLLRLNDDASSRVLFERILTSSKLPLEKSALIWDQYLEFETRLGGLVGIMSVSERRQGAFGKQLGEMPTALIIDRYRFMDLMPAPESDLRMLGYAELLSLSKSQEAASASGDKYAQADFPQPNLLGLIPFKPRRNCRSFFHPVPGGDFPPPTSVARVMSSIPPPSCYDGPFVKVDELLKLIDSIEIIGPSDPNALNNAQSVKGNPFARTSNGSFYDNANVNTLQNDTEENDGVTIVPPLTGAYFRRKRFKR